MSSDASFAANGRVMLVSFEGWSDAGAATSTALEHLIDLIGAEPLHAISADGYVDFQVNRPKLYFDEDGERVLEWPDTRLYGIVHKPGEQRVLDTEAELSLRKMDGSAVNDLFFLCGVEPARDWSSFSEEIVDLVDTWQIDFVIMLGSMYSDAPHSRPIVTTIFSDNTLVRTHLGAQRSDYEGPVGILTVIDAALRVADVPTASVWAQVPHYVHSAPSPKATLAILDKLEEVLDIVIPRGSLLREANDWEAQISRIAAADEDMSNYIKSLEQARDAASAPETTGEAIAHEIEKFLGGEPEENESS